MARVSFTVRQTTGASGSFLRYPDGSASVGLFPARTDYDSALRAQGVQSISTTPVVVGVFEAIPVSYGEVLLDWSLTINSVPTLVASVTSVLLVYSPRGIPQTVLSGSVLVESASIFNYDHTGLPQGKWAYYALFAHFTTIDGSSDYYQKVGDLEVLVPTDYGSTLILWNQLPAFARLNDTTIGSSQFSLNIGQTTLSALGYSFNTNGSIANMGDPVGPLLKFLSIFGFDMDGLRTAVDYLMITQDPQEANTEALDALSAELGLDITSNHLGGARIRGVLDNIGILRRSKGTPASASLLFEAVTGSNVGLNTANRTFTIYSQRANYITAPKDGATITTWRVANVSEIASPNSFGYTGYNAASAGGSDVTLSGQTWTLTSGAHSIMGPMIHLSSPIPVLLNDFCMFSVHSTTPRQIVWARLVTGAGAIVGWGQVVKNINGVYYIEIDVTANASSTTFTNCFLEFLVDCRIRPFVGQLYLAEVNHLGDYFDGSTIRGGWLVDGAGSVDDFRWTGSINSSISIYAEDYKRSSGAMKDIFLQAVPLHLETCFTIATYNGVRGVN